MPARNAVRAALVAGLLLIFFTACAEVTAETIEQPRYLGLTILHTNDVHGHLFPFDYDALGTPEVQVGGAARRATLIRQLRGAASGPVLVMDAGDVFTRGPLADLLGVPDFDVMNAVGYDIMTLGNNEFKGAADLEGMRTMMARIRQARFPVVSANVYDKATEKTIVPPYKVFDFEGLRVGVFGLTAQRVAGYSQARGLEIRDAVTTARKVVAELKSKCNFVVALTHIGYESDLQLAAAVPEIDVIIGGDSHTWLFQPTLVKAGDSVGPDWWVGGPVICQAGEWGRAVGKLQLSLRLTEDGVYRVMGYNGELITVDSSVKPAEDIERIINRYAKPYYRKVGTLEQAVVKQAAPAWLAELMRSAAQAQVAVEPRESVESGLPAGDVNLLDVRRMLPYINQVVKLDVTGKQLKQLISQFDNPGLAGATIVDGEIMIGDAKLQEESTYTVAVEDFYASASTALAGVSPQSTGKTTRELVTEFVAGASKK